MGFRLSHSHDTTHTLVLSGMPMSVVHGACICDLLQCQKRPITVSKETCYSVKRDLLQCQRDLLQCLLCMGHVYQHTHTHTSTSIHTHTHTHVYLCICMCVCECACVRRGSFSVQYPVTGPRSQPARQTLRPCDMQ